MIYFKHFLLTILMYFPTISVKKILILLVRLKEKKLLKYYLAKCL